MNDSILKFNKVIYCGDLIDNKILNTIIYYKKDDGYYFIEEQTFKKNLIKILDNDNKVKRLTSLTADVYPYKKLIKDKQLIIEPYEIQNPTIPHNILPMIF